MGITLNNTADSGTVNITLGRVVSYDHAGKTSYFKRKVPGKATPHTDTSTMTVTPTSYNFSAEVSSTEKVILETLKGEPGSDVIFSDNELSNKNCRVEDIRFTIKPGVESGLSPNNDPYINWIVNIRLTGLDH